MAVKHSHNGPFTTLADGQTAWEASHTVEDGTITAAMLADAYDAAGAAAAAQAASQPLDADLTAIAGLTSAADKGIQFTGVATAGTYDLTAAGKALLDDTDAAAQRTTLGLGTLATQSGTFANALLSGGDLGTPSGGVATNLTGTAASLTAGTVTTNANLTGDVTSVGNATTIGAGKVTTSMLAGYVLPTVVAVGTSATSAGSNITPGLPTGHTTNDILLLFCQSNQQALTAPAGYVQLGPAFGIGTAAVAGGTRGYVFWKRDGGSESAPTVTGAADHTLGQMMAVRGCVTTGQPFLNCGSARKVVASTTATAAAGDTPVDTCLVVNTFVHALDSASAVFSAWTNADLTSVTEQIDVATADGNGGGIGVATGGKTNSGTFTTTTATMTSGTDVGVTFVMLPAGIVQRAGFIDEQVFLTPGLADTWSKPTGANMVEIITIGGGASGSAGRNAATAAGGGGGGGGQWARIPQLAGNVAATMTVTAGAGGAATANSDGAASNAGNLSSVASGGVTFINGRGGGAAGASATGAGGLGGAGGGVGSSTAAGVASFGNQATGGGTGGTTAGAGGNGNDFAGGAGAGGGTTQGASAGGTSIKGGGGGGGGRSNTTVGTGGGSIEGSGAAGGSSAGANGTDSPFPTFGGAGGAAGTSSAGPGGQGGWPSGGGGGGGSQSGAQRGGAGGDGVVVIVTFC